MAVGPHRLDSIGAHAVQCAQLKRKRGELLLRSFVQMPHDVAFALATGAGAGAPKPLQADEAFRAIFPLHRDLIADMLHVQSWHCVGPNLRQQGAVCNFMASGVQLTPSVERKLKTPKISKLNSSDNR